MLDEVKAGVDSRVGYLNSYVTVPDEMRAEVDDFIAQTNALGERCTSINQFETEFANNGLNDAFTSIISRCMPIKTEVTAEDKRQMRETMGDFFQKNKGEMARGVVQDMGEFAQRRMHDDAITASRERMIEDGTMDDFARAHDKLTTIEWIADGLGGLFGKKK